MRAIAYAVPILLSLGVIVAGVTSWRAVMGKLAVAIGVAALLCSAATVYYAEALVGQVQGTLGELERVFGGEDGP